MFLHFCVGVCVGACEGARVYTYAVADPGGGPGGPGPPLQNILRFSLYQAVGPTTQ